MSKKSDKHRSDAESTKAALEREKATDGRFWEYCFPEIRADELDKCAGIILAGKARDEIAARTIDFLDGGPIYKMPSDLTELVKKFAHQMLKLERRVIYERAKIQDHIENLIGELWSDSSKDYDGRNDARPWKSDFIECLELVYSASNNLGYAAQSFKELATGNEPPKPGRPSKVNFRCWIEGLYNVWKDAGGSGKYSYDGEHYTGKFLKFVSGLFNLIRPYLEKSIIEALPSGLTRNAPADVQSEIDVIGRVVRDSITKPS